MRKRSDHELEHRHPRRGYPQRHRGYDPDFFGLDTEQMSPKARIVASLAVLIPVVIAAVVVVTLIPWLWWFVFVFGWMIFPAFGLLVRGIASLSEEKAKLPATGEKERELLRALREHGELTPAGAAMETSLTVAEADQMLKELAEGGHLEVRVRGGGLFYALWEPEGARRELEDQG
jgi:hypothetical protein